MTQHLRPVLRIVGLLLVLASILTGAARADTITYFHNDLSGSPVAATDASGRLLWKETYRPYGERLLNGAGPDANWLWFAGQPQDPDTGLSYLGARYYSPRLGRFVGIDPKAVDPADLHGFNRYAYANNNPYKFVDPDGRAAETFWDAFNIGLGVSSLIDNVSAGHYGSAIVDAAGVVVDSVAAVIPLVPGGAGSLIKVSREGAEEVAEVVAKEVPDFDTARRAAFEQAGMTDPSKVQFSKIDSETGTVVEFKGEGGAKVGYDGPHESPGPHHDTQHISWQSAGKRDSGGAQRGNEPYSGPQHPSRPDRKEQ